MDVKPLFSALNAAILLGAAFSFLIVGLRYPQSIKRALGFHAFANVAVALGASTDFLLFALPQDILQIAGLCLSGLGTPLYYLSYRCLQERTYHLRMVAAVYVVFAAAVVVAYTVIGNAYLGVVAISILDMILFALAARDVLVNLRGRGRAHLIQGIGLCVFVVMVGIWGGSFFFMPPAPVVTIAYGGGLAVGLAGYCFSSAFGGMNFLLMCNDEFNMRLQVLVGTDPLTGVANRRKLMERGEAEVARAHRYQYPLTVVMIDLDHFKALNDTFGHAAGDHALREAAKVCVTTLRDIDLVARAGGEEFAALLPQTPLVQGLEAAERLRPAIADLRLRWGSAPVPLTASFGVAELHLEDASVDQVIDRADRALYRSKADGRNRVSHEMPETAELLDATGHA